jgi:carboxymethylenebutenolidase
MMARRLASEGYVTLAVDLYGGRSAATPDEARALMQESLTQGEALMSSMDQALTHLRVVQGAPRVGVVGWCFGGGWSLETALAHPRAVDAAVMYYGRVITDEGRLAALEAPLLGHFGATDSSIPVADVRTMESALDRLGKDVEVNIYEGAGHAFANPSGQAYVEMAAEMAWGRTLAFFERHLRG